MKVVLVSIKAARGGQWAGSASGPSLVLALGLALGPLAACHRHDPAPEAIAPGARQTPSGLPVPRYVSLKFDKVNARGGPGDDYDLKWIYRVKGLPLQVVAETQEWRRVCDAQGSLSWVHRRTTDARRTVMRTAAEPVALHAKPNDASPETATLVGHAIADMRTCAGDWCRVSVGHAGGWVRASEVWGVAAAPQCH